MTTSPLAPSLLLLAGLMLLTLWLLLRRRQPEPALSRRQRELLARRLAPLARLSGELRGRFETRVLEFLRGKRFYGCGGLTVTDDMRLLIAGMACLLILRPDARVYPQLRSILVYPTAFWVRHEEPDDIGLVYDEEVLQLGESQEWGRVVLSWEDVEAALAGDPVNVAVHEFAHQLDEEGPAGEGAPRLPDYQRWSAVMRRAYEALCAHGSPVLDEYGAQGPAEFFAVATESYFQRGAALRRHHPELYALLEDFYQVRTA